MFAYNAVITKNNMRVSVLLKYEEVKKALLYQSFMN